MMTNEVLHVGDRNKVQAISYISARLSWLKLTNITHVEIIPGPNVSAEELLEVIKTSTKFYHSVKSAEELTGTIYVILN